MFEKKKKKEMVKIEERVIKREMKKNRERMKRYERGKEK